MTFEEKLRDDIIAGLIEKGVSKKWIKKHFDLKVLPGISKETKKKITNNMNKNNNMKKIYLPLLKEQRDRNIYFSSTLSEYRYETTETTRHEISLEELKEDNNKANEKERRLKDDKFFNNSHFKYNIIRS